MELEHDSDTGGQVSARLPLCLLFILSNLNWSA